MAAGCTNAAAINYDSLADSDDGSCIYIDKIGDTCYYFMDASSASVEDKSFTLSYAVDGSNWVFFHDYIPDFYFSTREKLHALKGTRVHTFNEGEPGKYFTNIAKSFFVDMVFAYKDEQTLDALTWITEVVNRASGANEEFSTLSHITIWNSWQTTGRIAISSIFDTLEFKNTAKSKSEWHFNDFRDIVITRGSTFLKDLFNNFTTIPGTTDNNIPWYDKKLIEDEYFIVRLEFDNSANKIVLLHDADADTTRSTI